MPKKTPTSSKKASASKAAAKKSTVKKAAPAAASKTGKSPKKVEENGKPSTGAVTLTPFVRKQKAKLLELRDSMLDSMIGVAKDNLRSRAEGSEASAFGLHQADAGSDAYDRDFALNLLSQEQNALYEIDEALKRIDAGTYGICEMSQKNIPHARLEAIPFARFTVDCQAQIENEQRATRVRRPVTSIFGLTEDDSSDSDDDDSHKD